MWLSSKLKVTQKIPIQLNSLSALQKLVGMINQGYFGEYYVTHSKVYCNKITA